MAQISRFLRLPKIAGRRPALQGRCEACGPGIASRGKRGLGIRARATQGARKAGFSAFQICTKKRQAPRRASRRHWRLDRRDPAASFLRAPFFSLAANPHRKSTLLIPGLCCHAAKDRRVVYISGEEASIRSAARLRLGLPRRRSNLAAETSVEDIVATLSHGKPPPCCD